MKTIHMTKKVYQIIGLVATLFLTISSAQAQTSPTTLTQTGSSLTESEKLKFGTVSESVATGAYQVKDSSGDQFWVYCLDPLTYINSYTSYTATSLSSFVNSGYTALFATSQYQANGIVNKYDDSKTTTATVLAKLTELYSHAYADSMTSADKSAAFQYAIWEIEGDSSVNYSGSTGGLLYLSTATAAFKSQVDIYLTALNTGNWGALSTVTNYIYTVYQSSALGKSQTVLTVALAPTNQVPEPSTMLLLGIGMLALGASRRAAKANKACPVQACQVLTT
jgi:hypothetical protein